MPAELANLTLPPRVERVLGAQRSGPAVPDRLWVHQCFAAPLHPIERSTALPVALFNTTSHKAVAAFASSHVFPCSHRALLRYDSHITQCPVLGRRSMAAAEPPLRQLMPGAHTRLC